VVLVAVGIAAAATSGDDDGDDDASPSVTASPSTVAETTAASTATTADATTAPTTAASAATTAATAAPSSAAATTAEASTSAPSTTAAPETTTTAAATTTTAAPTFSDGLFVVGTDIPPGVYQAEGSDQCHWERLRSADGAPGSVIAERSGRGQTIVTIADTDAAFRTEGCGAFVPQWTYLYKQTEISDGIWAVNAHIVPGRYRATPTSLCTWARLKSFLGSPDQVIRRGAPDLPTTIEILPGDVGFESHGCGVWTPA
jgi:hypothetical protein